MKVLNAVLAHKDFEWTDLPNEELAKYLVFTPNDIKTNMPNVVKFEDDPNFDNRTYSELAHLIYIRNNIDFDWIVINHYRRRLNVDNYNFIYVPEPFIFANTIREVYSQNHNVEDLDLMTEIIESSDIDLNFKFEWLKSLNENYMICWNMASCSREFFCNWIDTYVALTNVFKKLRNFNTFEDIEKHYSNDSRPEYNARILSFLAERISNCYFRTYVKTHNNLPLINNPLMTCSVKLLEPGQQI